MTISDEQLSAFLDAELPEPEMERVRQQLIVDENLADRLAQLAMVDEQIANHYACIDERPMPESIQTLLAQNSTAADNIVVFPRWKRVQQGVQKNIAIAACTLLVIGFGMVQLLPANNQHTNQWNTIAQVLEQNVSGSEQHLDDGSRVKTRLTFINNNGNYCRQFQLIQRDKSSENIACRVNNRWELAVSVSQETIAAGDYQTASGGSSLDSALDEMMHSEAFDVAAEQQAIDSHWSR